MSDLDEEHELLLQFLYQCPVGIIQINAHGDVELANPAATRLLMPIAQAQGFSNLFSALSEAMPELRSISDAMAGNRGLACQGREIDLSHDLPNGKRQNCWVSLSLLRLSQARQMAVLHDITELVAEREAHYWKATHLDTIFRNLKDYAIFSLDHDGRIEGWNSSVQDLLGVTEDDVIGKNFGCFWHETPGQTMGAETLIEIARQMGSSVATGWQVRADGSAYWAECAIAPLRARDGQTRSFNVLLRDVTEWKTAQERLIQLATTDFLTGLHNRRSFMARAETAVQDAWSSKAPLAVLAIDIDGTGTINDTLGQKRGDEAIKAIAGVVNKTIGSQGLCGRLSGQEFMVLLAGKTPEDALALGQDLQDRVAKLPFPIPLSVTLGMATSLGRLVDLDGLISEADGALKTAKAERDAQRAAEDIAPDGASDGTSDAA